LDIVQDMLRLLYQHPLLHNLHILLFALPVCLEETAFHVVGGVEQLKVVTMLWLQLEPPTSSFPP